MQTEFSDDFFAGILRVKTSKFIWYIFRFADGRAKPLPDDMEAAYLVYGYMENDTAIIRFLRPIDSGDLDRDLTLDTERYLQFARGPLGSNGDISYHSFRKTSDQMYNFYCGK